MKQQHSENAQAGSLNGAALSKQVGMIEQAEAHGQYVVECFDKDGNLKWKDSIENLVTTGGKNDALEKYLEGAAYTAAWYLGLIGDTSYTTGPAVADTMASHGGWAEDQNYSEGTRPAPAWGAAASGSKATTATSFSINASATIKGCFLVANSAKGGTSGILYSAGLFSGGDKVVDNGDTLNVTWTGSL
jgi:hypothetical protein